MRTVILEEHLSLPEMAVRPQAAPPSAVIARVQPLLADITGERLSAMDRCGITLQVLSVDVMGGLAPASGSSPAGALAFSSRYNDLIAERISAHRDRFAAFAHLPMSAPQAAADELQRAVQVHGFKGALIPGTTEDQFLDHPRFAPVLERAEKLGVPLYLHPGLPPASVAKAYYSDIGGRPGMLDSIACYGWGWHSETAIHVLRLLAAGAFDRYRGLRIIIGHMGEMLPMMMVRSNNAFRPGMGGANQRTLIETFREQLFITTSGLFTQPPFRVALDTFGVDRIMFSVDYPFSTMEMGMEFLRAVELPESDLEKIAHGNADKLLGLG